MLTPPVLEGAALGVACSDTSCESLSASAVLFAGFSPPGSLLRGQAVQHDTARVRASRVPPLPAREGGGSAAGIVPQNR